MSNSRLHKLGSGYQIVAILLLNTIILLLCFEVAASFILRMLDSQNEAELLRRRTSLSYYADQPWAESYWREHAQLQVNYAPYVIWRERPFTGQTINIDEQGHRQTPGVVCTPDAYRVFVFGGSTVWGHGVPDWGTIPAYLQTELAKQREGTVCVQNFGELGFVSTQGVIELLQQLQQGNVPHLVLFYDGFNDIAATYQNGRAGAHLNESRTGALLTQKQTLTGWLKTTHTYQLLTRLAARVGLLPTASPEDQVLDAENSAKLSEQVFQGYIMNYQVVAALAAEYGFAYHFFWQPLLATGNKPLTVEEQQMKPAASPLNTFYLQVYADMERQIADHPCLHNLGPVFDEQRELVWVDEIHLNSIGNEIVAEEMAQLIMAPATENCGGGLE